MQIDSKFDNLNLITKKLKFFATSPQMYQGTNGLIEYGPFGATIKSNLLASMRNFFKGKGFWEVESPILSPNIVWQASGHLERFVDIVGTSDGGTYRVDKVLEESYPELHVEDLSLEGLTAFCASHDIVPPGNKEALHGISEYNLMVQSNLAGRDVVLRPETATMSYLLFADCYEVFRRKLPIMIFQTGKAFRNEVTCRQGLIRAREFEQFEAQIFLHEEDLQWPRFSEVREQNVQLLPESHQSRSEDPVFLTLREAISGQFFEHESYAFCMGLVSELLGELGIGPKDWRLRQHVTGEMAHYAKDAWDVEVYTEQYGWLEVCGVHDRGTYDLGRHEQYAATKTAVPNSGNELELPRILEIAFGVGRLMYALLEQSTQLREDGKRFLNLPGEIAPIDIAVLPLSKKPELMNIVDRVAKHLQVNNKVIFKDSSGSIGKRYARMDELGVPLCITVDFDSLEDEQVTVRFRNSMSQSRVSINNLATFVQEN